MLEEFFEGHLELVSIRLPEDTRDRISMGGRKLGDRIRRLCYAAIKAKEEGHDWLLEDAITLARDNDRTHRGAVRVTARFNSGAIMVLSHICEKHNFTLASLVSAIIEVSVNLMPDHGWNLENVTD